MLKTVIIYKPILKSKILIKLFLSLKNKNKVVTIILKNVK